MQLQDADADNLKCTFVKDVYDTLMKRKYTINYCWDKAKLSYVYYAASLYDTYHDADCLLDEEFRCILKEHGEDAPVIDCSAPTQYTCAEQATITLTQASGTTTEYRARVRNPYDSNSGFAHIQLTDNSTTLTASINKYFEKLTSGSWIGVSATSLSTNSTLKVWHTQFFTPIVDYAAYIHEIRLGVINSGVITTFTINTSPSSPYLSVVGGYTVSAGDLTFDNATLGTHWDTYNKIVSNALRSVYGASAAAAFEMELIVSNTGAALSTSIKNNPSTYWAGIGIDDFRLTFFDGTAFKTYSSKPGIKLTQTPTWSSPSTTYSSLCGTLGITMTNPYGLGVSIINSGTTFRNIQLLSPNSTEAPPYNTSGSFVCSSWSLVASVTSLTPIQGYQWETTGGTLLLADSLTYNTSTAGTYVFKVILQNGCIITKQITTSTSS